MDESKVAELRQCAWAAWEGYKCTFLSERLVELKIENQFFVDVQHSAYRSAVLFWISLFGSRSSKYQRNRNFQRDIRIICNSVSQRYPDCSGHAITRRLSRSAGLSETEHSAFAERMHIARNNRFAHANPEQDVSAESLKPAELMFLESKDIIKELLISENRARDSTCRAACKEAIEAIDFYFKIIPDGYSEIFDLHSS